MRKIKSIFDLRCKNCHILYLVTEKHNCDGFKTTKNQRLLEKIWQLLDEHTYLTASALAIIIFGRNRIKEFTQKIKIIIKKNSKIFSCYYPKGHNYICTMETRINIKTKFFE